MKSINSIYFQNLSQKEQQFIEDLSKNFHLSYQEKHKLIQIAIDLQMWNETPLYKYNFSNFEKMVKQNYKVAKKKLLSKIEKNYDDLKTNPTIYNTTATYQNHQKPKISTLKKDKLGFGMCPVASPKTRCCNLMTLDVVESCGFDCSYCSIQSFYNENKIIFDKTLKEKLNTIKLDPNEFYHIGTGQSSDSLMWGNHNGILDNLINFAKKNPNVMLEFKTKSNNISYFLKHDIPKNIILTWSLNTQTIIDNEEHLTASLENRLEAAKRVHDKGILVGFHFHPMIYYKNWQKEYKKIFDHLTKNFDPKNVAMVSLGTLTFIKPVIKTIRSRDFKSKILQIPFANANGKLSYPIEIKKEIFRFAYESLSKWHKKVFFYLCMEEHSLWKEVFSYEYPTNETFENDMKLHYLKKITRSS